MTVKDHRKACDQPWQKATYAIAMAYQQLAKNVPENSQLLFGENPNFG